MLSKLLAIFVLIPLVEMMLLIKMGESFGFGATLLFILVTGFAGALASKIQGLRTWTLIQKELRAGRLPAEEMIDAFLIFFGGILLITPGVLTDLTGIILMIPWTRYWFKRWLRKKFDSLLRDPGQGDTLQYRFFIGS